MKFLKGNELILFGKLGMIYMEIALEYMDSQEYSYNLCVHYYSSLTFESVNYREIGNMFRNSNYREYLKTEPKETLNGMLWVMYSRSTPKDYWLIPNEIGQINPIFESLCDNKMCEMFDLSKLGGGHPDENMCNIRKLLIHCHKLDPPLIGRRRVFMTYVRRMISVYGTMNNLIFILYYVSGMFNEKMCDFVDNSDSGESLMVLIEKLFGAEFWFLGNNFSH